jgi:hypothetical protein
LALHIGAWICGQFPVSCRSTFEREEPDLISACLVSAAFAFVGNWLAMIPWRMAKDRHCYIFSIALGVVAMLLVIRLAGAS